MRTQDFLNFAGTERRFRNLSNTFTDELFGGEVQLQSNFRWGKIDNRLTYGFDLSKTNNERTRDGLETRF